MPLMRITRLFPLALLSRPAINFTPTTAYCLNPQHPRTMSLSHENDNTTPATQRHQNEQPETSENKTPLGLPPPPEDDSGTTKLSVDGQAVKLDHLGPLVVNKDGTLSRIANWEHMTDIEKKNTLRILVKRNQIRTEALKEGAAAEGQSNEGQAK